MTDKLEGRSRGEVLSHFAPEVRKQRRKLTAGVVFAVIYSASRVIEPWPLKVVFDQVLFHKPVHGLASRPFAFLGSSAYDLLAAAAIVLMVASVVRGMSYYYEDFLLSSAAQQIVYGIRARLYRHLHRLPLAFHQRRSAGDTLVRLSADIVLLRDVLVDAIVNLGTGVVLIALMLAVMFAVDPVLTGVSLAVMPAIALCSSLYGSRIRVNSRKQRKREGQVAAAMHESLAAIDVVQLHGATRREEERFRDLNRRSLKQGTKAVRLEAQMNRSVELMLGAGTVVILWVGSLRVLRGALTPGELIVFVSYLRAAYRPLRRASKTVQRSAKALAAAERIVEVLEVEPELGDAPDARPAPPLTGEIDFQEVAFAYVPARPVLHDVSFHVEPGATLAIVGETGSGKSTLVSLVPRLFDPTAGCIRIDGTDVRTFTLESLRAQISVVQQDSVLFGLSVADNIRYGKPEASDEELRAAAEAAALDEFVARLPAGYETVISERGTSLSGGERRRVAIARALVRRSPILILDEPTNGLDPQTRAAVLTAIRELTDGATTLLITHDMELARRADRILVLIDGHIAGVGRYTQLLDTCADFRRLVDSHDGHARLVAFPALQTRHVRHLIFFAHDNRYLLTERDAPLPQVGSEVVLDEPTARAYIVTRLAVSPLPHDERPCAYLEPIPRHEPARPQSPHRAGTGTRPTAPQLVGVSAGRGACGR